MNNKEVVNIFRFFDAKTKEKRNFYSEDVYDITTKQYLSDIISATKTETARLKEILSKNKSFLIVPDIIARDALKLDSECLVWVEDATGDATVKAGGAAYIPYLDESKNNHWQKISETESLDIILSWEKIENDKPTSTVADIDEAATQKHNHTNSTVLEAISTNTDNQLTFGSYTLKKQTGIDRRTLANKDVAGDYTSKLLSVTENLEIPDPVEEAV